MECLPFRQYLIKMDHSGRVTRQNRRYIRKFVSLTPSAIAPLPSATITEEPPPHQLPILPPQPNPLQEGQDIEAPLNPEPIIPQPPPEVVPAVPLPPARQSRMLKRLQTFNNPGLREWQFYNLSFRGQWGVSVLCKPQRLCVRCCVSVRQKGTNQCPLSGRWRYCIY